MPPYTLLNDRPALKDALSRDALLDRVADQVTHSVPPLAIGIHGDWGSGKTSFLRQLRLLLDFDADKTALKLEAEKHGAHTLVAKSLARSVQPVVTVWFEAWRYQNEPAPIVALLHEMRAQLPNSKKVIDKLSKLTQITTKAILGGLSDIANKISIDHAPSGQKIEAIGEKWERENFRSALLTENHRDHLEQLSRDLLPRPIRGSSVTPRLVIFVDDLDRCNPEAVYRLLEGIKISEVCT